MRRDETGQPCPETLGEYHDLCDALAPGSAAVALLVEKIASAENGRLEKVVISDAQMRALLFPLLVSGKE